MVIKPFLFIGIDFVHVYTFAAGKAVVARLVRKSLNLDYATSFGVHNQFAVAVI
ncbi:MAG: hypothetical protein WC601_11960 [Desulfotomaculaceae bacterium]